MNDIGTQLGYQVQKKDFVDIVANIDTDGIRAYDATVYNLQIAHLKTQLQSAMQETEDLRIVR